MDASPRRAWTAPPLSSTSPSRASKLFPDYEASSALYGLLPATIQSRVPRFASIRRSMGRNEARPLSWSSPASDATLLQTNMGLNVSQATRSRDTRPPPPAYFTAVGDELVLTSNNHSLEDISEERSDSGSSRRSASSTEEEEEEEEEDNDDDNDDDDDETIVQSTLSPERTTQETNSGLDWKFANQGLSLLTQSFHESTSAEAQDDAALTRQLYLHAVSYILRGLPSDLGLEERLSLQSALPPALARPSSPTTPDLGANPVFIDAVPQAPSGPSLLQSVLTMATVHVFIVAQFLLSYTQLLMGASTNAVDALSRRAWALDGAVELWVRGMVGGGMGLFRIVESSGEETGGGNVHGGWRRRLV